ncbi:MAG: ABC transporter ATP-binding protein, partial [Bacteroidetes bacterium]|nr:ABC transporter ATP-binding protein [Bacteroidota bacterium]
MILEIDNVELYFKDKTILKGVYLKAETGKVTGILGSNGSGKSCLLEIIFGSLKPKYKLIRIDGSPLLKPLFKTKFVKFLPQYHFIPNVIKLKNVFKLYNVDWNTFVDEVIEFSAYENFKVN